MMPTLDGFEVTRLLKSDPATSHIPIILVTGLDDKASRLKGLSLGAEEFVNKPIDRAELFIRVRNLLKLKEFSDFLEQHNYDLEQTVKHKTAQLRNSYRDTIYLLTQAAEYRDDDTGAHVKRICHYCRELSSSLGLDETFKENIFFSSAMHDIGKIGIPDAVLLKPGPLNSAEWEIMKTHATLGANILSGNSSQYILMGKEIAQFHHERWDGTGYPYGLKGEATPLSARIMALCDVYDALRSHRPYKLPFDHAQTIEIIVKGDGRTKPNHFDPAILDTFKNIATRFDDIFNTQAINANTGSLTSFSKRIDKL
jgi:putative two-component system response regulator